METAEDPDARRIAVAVVLVLVVAHGATCSCVPLMCRLCGTGNQGSAGTGRHTQVRERLPVGELDHFRLLHRDLRFPTVQLHVLVVQCLPHRRLFLVVAPDEPGKATDKEGECKAPEPDPLPRLPEAGAVLLLQPGPLAALGADVVVAPAHEGVVPEHHCGGSLHHVEHLDVDLVHRRHHALDDLLARDDAGDDLHVRHQPGGEAIEEVLHAHWHALAELRDGFRLCLDDVVLVEFQLMRLAVDLVIRGGVRDPLAERDVRIISLF